MNRKYGIFSQLVLMLALFLMLIIGAGVWSVGHSLNQAERQINDILENDQRMARMMVMNDIKGFASVAPVVRAKQREFSALYNDDRYDTIGIVLQDLASFFDIDLLLFVSDEGVLATSSDAWDEASPLDLGGLMQLPGLERGGHLFEMPPSLARLVPGGATGSPISYVTRVPIQDFSGEQIGRVILLKKLSSRLHLVHHLGTNSEVIVTSMDDKTVLSTLKGDRVWADAAKTALMVNDRQYAVSASTFTDARGDDVFRLLIALDRQPFLEHTFDLIAGNILLTGLLVVAGLLLYFFMKRRFIQPVQAQVNALQRVAGGDLSVRVPVPEDDASQRRDEIVRMGDDFNTMMDRLEALYGDLKARTEDMAAARRDAVLANRAKSAFLANMSHELRTPLNAVIGYSEMILEDMSDAGDQTHVADLDKIRGSGKHLLTLINDVLDISKIEAGQIELHRETVDIGRLITEAAATAKPMMDRNGNTLDVRVSGDLGAASVDVTRLNQILLNLLSNAAKFTEKGQVSIRAELRNNELDKIFECVIADTGIGIPADKVEVIFDAFTQADSSTTRKFGGTGLGLPITRRLCEMMGGSISVQSTPGEGTVFAVRIPLYED